MIADGGIRYSGDIASDYAFAGADTVMLGGFCSPAQKKRRAKSNCSKGVHIPYRGMGSLGAMQASSSDRYFQRRRKLTWTNSCY